MSKSEQRSWLVADDDVRRRLLDIEPIIGRAHRGSVVAILAVVPFIARGRGIWLVGVGVSYALAVLALEATVRHSRRAEYPIIAKTILSLATLAVVALLTGGPNSPALLLLVVSIVPASARFDLRGISVVSGTILVLLVGVSLSDGVAALLRNPDIPLITGAAGVNLLLYALAMRGRELQHRRASVVDPLTGLLNRVALDQRAAELAEHSQVTRQPVAVIVGDIDHFKAINDAHGHLRGDAVLGDVGLRLRTLLRAFDAVYRIGGEEFLVLLPGADAVEATDLAERLREGIAASPCGGLPVTMSLGTAATEAGDAFVLEPLLGRADAALYRAKRAGRDQVCAGTLLSLAS